MRRRLYVVDVLINRVNLSNFRYVVRGIDKAGDRTFESICNWLLRGFKRDPGLNGVSMHVVVNRSAEGVFWELIPITSTIEWRSYIENAIQRQWPFVMLVHTYEKPVYGSNDEEVEEEEEEWQQEGGEQEAAAVEVSAAEAEGVTDEGERIGNIVE